MPPSAQVKKFAKIQSMKVSGAHGAVMISKEFPNGEGFIKFFDNWVEALDFLAKAEIARKDFSVPAPWSNPNN